MVGLLEMEKKHRKNIRIVVNGSESTGKTTLARELSQHYNCIWIPEFARTYIERLNVQYTYNDVCAIQKKQQMEILEFESQKSGMAFWDTDLIITKIWFSEVYKKLPENTDNFIRTHQPDIYLVCDTDLPWVYDQVRENPTRREYLNNLYIHEIEAIGTPFFLVSGTGHKRTENAIHFIEKFLAETKH